MSAIESWCARCGMLALLAASASCTLIYDADVFQYIDAAPPPDAYVAPDADPTALRIDRLDPPVVLEGAGCIALDTVCRPDSRRVPVVIHGANITADAEVVVSGPGFADPGVTLDLAVAPDGTRAAFELSVPVLPELGRNDTPALTITVRQGMAAVDAGLPVRSLDEFVASVDAPAGTLDTAMLRDLYSRIDIDAPVTFTGTGRVRLVAVSELVVAAAVHADGANGVRVTPGAGGPGGCRGGAPGAAGDCPDGGGQPGASGDSGGGGGGGHAEQGASGSGQGGGSGGMATGAVFLTPLAPGSPNSTRGNGGGGGGDNCGVNDDGGAGGGGGGTIELTSHGALRLTAEASLSAVGGDGSAGNCGLGSLGGGGGGSGGAVFARAAMDFTDEGTEPRVDVGAGQGGGPSDNQAGAGGDGAPGRVRVDLPGGGAIPPAFSAVIHRYRGPMWNPASPVIVRAPGGHTLELHGEPNAPVFVDVEGQPRRDLSFPPEGVLAIDVDALALGQNQICARVTASADASQPDAFNCIDIAYIPQ